jgi:hypothetical protein
VFDACVAATERQVESQTLDRQDWTVEEYLAKVDDVTRAGMWHSGSPTPDDSKRIRVNGGAMLQQFDSLKREILKRVTPLYLELLDPDGCFPTGTGATQNIMDQVKQQYYLKFGRKSEGEPEQAPAEFTDKFLACWQRYGPLAESCLQAACLL